MYYIERDRLIGLLDSVGIEYLQETAQDFICYCPFHSNRDTPALNISKEPPNPWRCWNSVCGESGTLPKLIEKAGGMSTIQALRHINTYRSEQQLILDDLFKKDEKKPYEVWSEDKLERIKIDLDIDEALISPLLKRGYLKSTLRDFEVGFSRVKERIVIPVRDENGDLVGFTGRAVHEWQKAKYWDKGLPKRYILFNLNNAKVYDTVVVVEGPLDVLKVYQAGFPGVVATLGGSFTDEQAKKLTKFFRHAIIFTDADEAGRGLASKIEEVARRSRLRVTYARYPDQLKDPGALTEDEISKAITNRQTLLEHILKGD